MDPLPTEISKVSPAILEATRNFVRWKDALDRARTDRVVRSLLPTWLSTTGATFPAAHLVENLLPFVDRYHPIEDRHVRVPTDLVVADAWRGRDPNTATGKVIMELNSDARAFPGGGMQAQYTLIEPLGLAFPHEGKNRVALFRAQGMDTIPCCLSVLKYPAAARMRLYQVDPPGLGTSRIVCVLDGRWVQELPLPAAVLPLLSAYGVHEIQPWPSSLPALTRVPASMFEPPDAENTPKVLDLEDVAGDQRWVEKSGQRVPVSIQDLDLELRLRPVIEWVTGIAAACVVATVCHAFGWNYGAVAAGATAVGVAGGAYGMLNTRCCIARAGFLSAPPRRERTTQLGTHKPRSAPWWASNQDRSSVADAGQE